MQHALARSHPLRQNALERAMHRRAVEEAPNYAGFETLIGPSAAMQTVRDTARSVAKSSATVLVTGETGTGKNLLARAIHLSSDRSTKPFVELHCASLADSLLESELFGHERGAFTGADRQRTGHIERSNGGTLFLDEIGELSSRMQVKLLRVMQEHAFERVGGNETIHVDLRLLAATNRDLASDVDSGRFREDLYYRLHVVPIEIPPLRLRGSDVDLLADHFLRKFALENGRSTLEITPEVRAVLRAHTWPGNVRALANTIQRAVVLCGASSVIDRIDLPAVRLSGAHAAARIPGSTMAELEREAILKTFEASGRSTSRAASVLQISVRTIQYRLREYGVDAARRPALD